MKVVVFNYKGSNYTIIIGTNKTDNFKIIDDSVDTDIWFHVNNEPSCHVILKNLNKLNQIPKKVIKRCAYLCKINSKAKREKEKDIIYTEMSKVIKTEEEGKVLVSSYKIVKI